jgi:outer membrane protein assembly factor BamB
MSTMKRAMGASAVGALLLAVSAGGQDWPQWRGPNRDARATGFVAPKTWPKELQQKWSTTVGDGVATPALVGDKLYVFSREGGNEVIRCLNAADGKQVWIDKYESGAVTGAAKSFPGPRSSPTVADGKVVTLGVVGIISCLDAAKGTLLWRKTDYKSLPRFYTSSSPIIVDGKCIVQTGGESKGAIVALDLATGDEKWKWADDGTAYASPSLLTMGTDKAIVAETDKFVVAINLADGKLLWKTPFAVKKGGRGYNAATPMVEGQTVIYAGSGRGATAVKIEKGSGGWAGKELWSNSDNSVIYNTPVVKDGLVYGLSAENKLFCIDKDGKTAWSAPLGGGGGRGGYGSIVDAGAVLFALTPNGQLTVFEPNGKEFKQLASYKVASEGAYAYPIIAGNRIFIKNKDAVVLWSLTD